MSKISKLSILIIIAVIAAAGMIYWWQRTLVDIDKETIFDFLNPRKACTQEAKLCADGSYVGRTGPNCEFAPCPGESEETCKNLCGDGVCQEIVCLAIGCPCPETKESCPQDCPAIDTVGWKTYWNKEYGFEVKYPAKYKLAQDTYGWPHSLALLISPSGQYYIVQIEIWDKQEGFKNAYQKDPSLIVKSQDSEKYITINYLADSTEEKDCQTILSTFKFTP